MSGTTLKLPRVDLFDRCITRACTIKAVQHGALNLSQGFPETDPPDSVKAAATSAINQGANQYADMRGLPALRKALAERYRERYGMPWVDPDRHVSITCGATEAMAAAIVAVAGPGDEVIVQEPTYENYPPQVMIAAATVRYLPAEAPEWAITREALERVFNPKTKAIILNGPNNPTGRVYSRAELTLVSEFCQRYDAVAIVDEIYEHLVWDRREHIRLATLPGMESRTVTISGASKVYSVTGWRIGWAVAPHEITSALQRIHDFMTAAVPTPLQIGVVTALALDEDYYKDLVASYESRRALLSSYLLAAELDYQMPEGAYYFFPSCEGLRFNDSEAFADALLDAGVAVVPYTAFHKTPGVGRMRFRINFAKRETTLREAGEKLVDFCRASRA